MKRLNDPRLQRLATYLANDRTIPATAQQQFVHELMAIDAELTAAHEERETRPEPAPKGKRA